MSWTDLAWETGRNWEGKGLPHGLGVGWREGKHRVVLTPPPPKVVQKASTQRVDRQEQVCFSEDSVDVEPSAELASGK